MNVLITGISGLIGSLLAAELTQRHNVRGLSRSGFGDYEQVNASINDYDAILPAFKDTDVVVHLAAFREDEPVSNLFRTNIKGVRNAFTAAVKSGTSRLIFASCSGVVRGHLGGRLLSDPPLPIATRPLNENAAPWPIRPYDATKAAGESIARVFNENHGIETVCVRIGNCMKDDVPPKNLVQPLWVSQRDITQLLTRCVEHPGPIGFELIYGVSANTPPFVDITRARDVFGYRPQDGCDWRSSAVKEKGGAQ